MLYLFNLVLSLQNHIFSVRLDFELLLTGHFLVYLFQINHLNDTHKQLMVHWVGENSKVVICLARDPSFGLLDLQPINPSAVYISYDDGDNYVNKTDFFKLSNVLQIYID